MGADDDDMLGVLAELATVDDAVLSQILAHFYSSKLAVLVVTDIECEQRVTALLEDKVLPVPDFLPLSLCPSEE